MQKTHIPKTQDIPKKCFLVDADGQTLGRLATKISKLLIGKHKAEFTAHIPCGDTVIVINAEKVKLTGNKLTQKVYYKHSGFLGGLKTVNAEKKLETDPTFLITNAVKGMLPKNKLQDGMMKNLKVYAGPEHPHEAQKPEILELN